MFIQHQVHSALIGTSFKELLVAAQHKYVYLSEVCGLFLKRNIHIYKSTVHIYVFTVDVILIHLRAVKVNLNYFPDKLRTSSTYKVKINVCHCSAGWTELQPAAAAALTLLTSQTVHKE